MFRPRSRLNVIFGMARVVRLARSGLSGKSMIRLCRLKIWPADADISNNGRTSIQSRNQTCLILCRVSKRLIAPSGQ